MQIKKSLKVLVRRWITFAFKSECNAMRKLERERGTEKMCVCTVVERLDAELWQRQKTVF